MKFNWQWWSFAKDCLKYISTLYSFSNTVVFIRDHSLFMPGGGGGWQNPSVNITNSYDPS